MLMGFFSYCTGIHVYAHCVSTALTHTVHDCTCTHTVFPQRFISPKYHSPACTVYQSPHVGFCMSGGGGGEGGGGAPFGQTSARFRTNRVAREIPGTTYNVYIHVHVYTS